MEPTTQEKRTIKQLIASHFGVENLEDIVDTADLREDFGAADLEIADFAHILEDRFGIVIEPEDIQNWRTVGDIINYIGENAEDSSEI